MLDQSRKIYFSPEDDTKSAYLAWVKTATKGIYIADYSFNMVELVDTLIEKYKSGIPVKLVLDKSQSHGSTEEPEVQRLREANIPLMVGTSPEHHIMHSKYTVIDGNQVEYGSWNYTEVASKESNFIIIENNEAMALLFLKDWNLQWDWISVHEKQTP